MRTPISQSVLHWAGVPFKGALNLGMSSMSSCEHAQQRGFLPHYRYQHNDSLVGAVHHTRTAQRSPLFNLDTNETGPCSTPSKGASSSIIADNSGVAYHAPFKACPFSILTRSRRALGRTRPARGVPMIITPLSASIAGRRITDRVNEAESGDARARRGPLDGIGGRDHRLGLRLCGGWRGQAM